MKIDVVVPIYNAFSALKNCLTSLEQNQQHANQIILINDASTDKRVQILLEEFQKRNSWQVIHHKKNKGFVVTANEGLQLSENNTLLLNSDTIVSRFWLQAFQKALIENKQLGTATAWSNNAEICSFPNFLQNNPQPAALNKLAQILYENYQPSYPKIPTAVGFCMLVSKQAKEKVGYFDEQHFGHGYGEENDYSLRIEQKGLINILCDNAYVIHVGNESFNDFGLQPNEGTMQRLLQKHPGYLNMIQDYINQDPLNTVRAEILNLISIHDNKLYQALK